MKTNSLLYAVMAVALSYSGCAPCSVGKDIRVKLLPNAAPDSLSTTNHPVWSDSYLIMRLGPEQQWRKIRGRDPKPTGGKDDFGVLVYMAHDKVHWYVGVDVTDDVIRDNSTNSDFLYSGDAFELFLTAGELEYLEDFHNLTERNPRNRRAFLQIQVPPGQLAEPSLYFSKYRTNPSIVTEAKGKGFLVRTDSRQRGWRAILRIPFDLIDQPILGEHRRVKVGIDFLDYDERIAPPDAPFQPANVACADREELNVNVPICMRRLVFEN